MATANTLTRNQRRQLKDHYNADKIRQETDGSWSVHTSKSRGDGGKVPWWMSVGYYDDLVQLEIITED